MPKGQLFINGMDAFEEWGVSLDSKGLSALMTPPGMKDNLKVSSRLENGVRAVQSAPKIKERTLTFILNIIGKNETEFLSRYNSFCSNVLMDGEFTLRTSFQPGVIYHLEYNDCSQFSEFVLGIGKFTLKCTENDPTNRR